MLPFCPLGPKTIVGLMIALGSFRFGGESTLLPVPFAAQAPEANWTQPWQDACEETSIVMVDAFYRRKPALSPEEAKQGILKVLAAKEKTLGPSYDESVATVAKLAEAMALGWKAEIRSAPLLEELLAELQAGRPVIVPVYAPELENPHYAGEGPDYHMLVLVGYDPVSKQFIVHDPGTSRGQALRFGEQRLMRAIHDLNPADYGAGAKRVLFTRPA